MQWKTVRIFISSTFNDMHAERDFLVKYVFPELAIWCEARKLKLIDIDLRWGVSTADSQANNTVMACLRNIDESRPFFLCFLGQRRGWVPELRDISKSTYDNYPGIEEYVGKSSVTELEIEHALLQPMLRMVAGERLTPQPVNHALFFFRNNPFFGTALSEVQRNIYTNAAATDPALADAELASFKDRVRSKWSVCEYDCTWDPAARSPELQTEGSGAAEGRLMNFAVNGVPLKDIILDALKKEIAGEFPENRPVAGQSLLEIDLEQQEQFVMQCAEGVIARENGLRALNEYVSSASRQPFILTAAAGLGKTTLLASFVLLQNDSDKCITARFCGASDLSSSWFGLWKSIFAQHGIPFREDVAEIKRDIYNLLSQLRGTLIIDGVDQLANGVDMLSWLPHELPQGLKLIISVKEDANARPALEAASQYAVVHSIEPFSAEEDKLCLINEYLKRFLKNLDEQHMRILCQAKGSENPLFLKVVLANLRVFGAYKQLESAIAAFGDTPVAAFDAVLKSLEHDTSYVTKLPGEKCVPLLFGLLACARNGLTEDELLFCFRQELPKVDEETVRVALRVYIRRVRPFIARREGRIDFLYDSFRIAARERYVANLESNHKLLAACFAAICDPEGRGAFAQEVPRALTELAYHLCQADSALGEALLCNCAYLNARCSACGSGELILDYDMLPNLSNDAKQIRSLLVRFSDVFSKYKNAFFSMALSCNISQARDMLQASERPATYILAKRVTAPPYSQTSATISGLPLRILASYKLDKTVAVCVPKNAPLALFSEAIGRLRLIDLDTMAVDEKVIITSLKRPLDIFASPGGQHIVITYDDETAEIIRLHFVGKKFVASQSVATIDYYLPLFSDAIFACSDAALWYQKDVCTLAKLDAGGELLVSLAEEGEITAFAVGGALAAFALRTATGVKLCRMDKEEVLVIGEFADSDILGLVILESGDLVVSFSDATVRLFDKRGEEKGRINLAISCALVVEVDKGVFCVAERSRKAFLWDLQDGVCSGELPELEYNRKISASYYGGLLHVISDQHVLTASVTEDKKLSALLLSIFFAGEDLVQVFQVGSHTLQVQRGGQAVLVPVDSAKVSLSRVENKLLVFDEIGTMAIVVLGRMTVQRGVAKFRPVSVASAQDGYYCADAVGFLHYFPSEAKLPSLSGYMLSSISLHVFGDMLLLTGISTSARAAINNTPYLMLLFRINTDNSLTPLCERYFAKDRGMFIDACFSEASQRLYVFFSTPYSGSAIAMPTVSFGTVEEFVNSQEKQMDVFFERKQNSFCVSENTLFVCGGGVVSAFEASSLKYLGAIASEGGFRSLVSGCHSIVYVLSGSSDIYTLQHKC